MERKSWGDFLQTPIHHLLSSQWFTGLQIKDGDAVRLNDCERLRKQEAKKKKRGSFMVILSVLLAKVRLAATLFNVFLADNTSIKTVKTTPVSV